MGGLQDDIKQKSGEIAQLNATVEEKNTKIAGNVNQKLVCNASSIVFDAVCQWLMLIHHIDYSYSQEADP